MSDRQVRVFRFKTGKLIRKYDESLQVVSEMQQAGTAIYRLDDMEFGRRLAVEKELEKSPQAITANAGIIFVGCCLFFCGATALAPFLSLVFDESGNFIIYATLLGIKGTYLSLMGRETRD